jgi:hypothetical protein
LAAGAALLAGAAALGAGAGAEVFFWALTAPHPKISITSNAVGQPREKLLRALNVFTKSSKKLKLKAQRVRFLKNVAGADITGRR